MKGKRLNFLYERKDGGKEDIPIQGFFYDNVDGLRADGILQKCCSHYDKRKPKRDYQFKGLKMLREEKEGKQRRGRSKKETQISTNG